MEQVPQAILALVIVTLALVIVSYLPGSLLLACWHLTRPAVRVEATQDWFLWLLLYIAFPPVGWYRAYRLTAPIRFSRHRLAQINPRSWALAHVVMLFLFNPMALMGPRFNPSWMPLVLLLAWVPVPVATVLALSKAPEQSGQAPPAKGESAE